MRHTQLRHHDTDSTTTARQHEALCEAMRALAHEESTRDSRKEAVGVLLVHLAGMSVAHVYEEGVQRLSRLWLEHPPTITWREEVITVERVERFLRVSVKRSEGAVRRRQARTSHMLSGHDADERAHAMRTTQGSLLTARQVREGTRALEHEITQLAHGLIARHATRRDQRENLSAALERLCQINLFCSFEQWLALEHPHLTEAAQQRLLRDRYHQQHTRARRFFHLALLAEPDLEMSPLASRFFAQM